MVTEWVQKNQKKAGTKSWERYERYNKSGTIRQALTNCCTWVDIQYDSTHGNLRINMSSSGTDRGGKNNKGSPKLKSFMAKSAVARRRKGIRSDKEDALTSTRRRNAHRNGVVLGHCAKKGRYNGTGKAHTGNDNGQAYGPPEIVSCVTMVQGPMGTEHPGHSNAAITFVPLEPVVPLDVQYAVSRIPSKAWPAKSKIEYMQCRSLYFGLGLVRYGKGHISRGSQQFPEMQATILKHLISIQPQSCFSSFIVNRYEVGDQMRRHFDNNMLGQSMQLVLVWGDFRGGDLVIGRNTDPHSRRACAFSHGWEYTSRGDTGHVWPALQHCDIRKAHIRQV
jgi:hypothetical protein